MRTLLLTVASVACLAATGALAAGPPPTVKLPKVIDGGAKLSWVIRPDADKVSALANDDGARHGRAVVECVINGAGRPKDCVVIEAEGNGFGRFVTDLAGIFKAASKDADGKSSEGRKVRVTYALEGTSSHP
ncbi:hypothetical protein [Caulobacter sp. NIBR1757]|uniref:hypothetical protein n=1 Tax=Caulobacter sp. NIBR1757 TaxID=3016000 RepID=UPI0022F07947|nr:hypothetical protein [Caulobacter sp. NIBR1757]WGM39376.1 hypothetical protein AMEJIAPC_02295 [Caulobacter sp. NIBR1757]